MGKFDKRITEGVSLNSREGRGGAGVQGPRGRAGFRRGKGRSSGRKAENSATGAQKGLAWRRELADVLFWILDVCFAVK